MSKYDFVLDLNGANSLSLIIKHLSPNSRILEFGPANGRLTKYLKEKLFCEVDIVEYDEAAGQEAAKYALNSFVGKEIGDIEKYKWLETLKLEKYNFIIFADVLEHLYHPEEVMKKCRTILAKNGVILISIPNIAHNSVLLGLINDEFQYNELGLLDETHIRFFTYNSFLRLISESGFAVTSQEAVYTNVGGNEIKFNYNMVTSDMARELKMRDKGNAYQYIFEIKKREDVPIDKICPPINKEIDFSYNCVCYVKENKQDDYCEEKIVVHYLKPKLNKKYKIEFSLEKFTPVSEIRIDPLNVNCILNIKNISVIYKNEIYNNVNFLSNGIKIDNECFIFSNNDPQFYINFPCRSADKLIVEFEIINYENSILGFLGDIIGKIIAERDNLYRSRAWKYISVLRKIKNVIKLKN